MTKIKFIQILLFLTLVLQGCSGVHDRTSVKESIIKNSLNYIKSNDPTGMQNCFLVDSYISPIQFELFFHSDSAYFKNKFGDNYKEVTKKIENNFNKETNEHDNTLSDFSSCSESNYIINFSRITDHYVMCYLTPENRIISKQELLDRKESPNTNRCYFYLFEFNNSGKITNVFENSVIYG